MLLSCFRKIRLDPEGGRRNNTQLAASHKGAEKKDVWGWLKGASSAPPPSFSWRPHNCLLANPLALSTFIPPSFIPSKASHPSIGGVTGVSVPFLSLVGGGGRGGEIGEFSLMGIPSSFDLPMNRFDRQSVAPMNALRRFQLASEFR